MLTENSSPSYESLRQHLKEDYVNFFRVGSIDDGGYYLDFLKLQKSDLLFSGGISSNVEFEYDVFHLNKDIKIIMVDPTVSVMKLFGKGILRSVMGKKEKLRYLMNTFMFTYMLNSKRCIHQAVWLNATHTIQSVLGSSGFKASPRSVILKLDIEGSEYDLLDEIVAQQELFNTIIIEFHDFDKKADRACSFIENCLPAFELRYLEINPSGGFSADRQPKNIEIVLIRK